MSSKVQSPRSDVSKCLETSTSSITFGVVLYTVCSSLLLLVNKIAVESVPSPNFILWLQLLTSAGFVACCSLAGSKAVHVQEISQGQLLRFVPAALGFLGLIYANIKTLQHANVETFIVFRCSAPLLVSITEYFFLGRDLPSTRSWLSLLGILIGAVGYVMSEDSFQVDAVFWVIIWYAFFAFEMTYLKHICNTIDISNWSRVFYNNFMGLFPLTILGIFSGSYRNLSSFDINPYSTFIICLSCVIGIGMSFTSFWLRSTFSATSFALIGILCKIATVVLNYFYWDKHATNIGIACLLVCLFSGSFYKQAPMREEKKVAASEKSKGNDPEIKILVESVATVPEKK